MNSKPHSAAAPGQTSSKSPGGTAAVVATDAAELLKAGLQHHQAGRLAEAEACYRRVLAAEPEHAGALHLLGGIALQVGRYDLAVELIGQAIKRDGRNPIYFSNLGVALEHQDKLDQAAAAYRQAIHFKPDRAEAHSNLGNVLKKQSRLGEALASYDKALTLKVGSPGTELEFAL